MLDKNIDKLIIKFVENTATLDEQVKLKQFLEIEKNRAYFDEYVELNYLINSKVKFDYNNTLDEVMGKIESKPKSLIMYKYLKYAAAIILLISTGYFLTKNQVKTTSKVVIDNKIPIGTDKATLTLEDGSTVALEKGKVYKNNKVSSDGKKIVYQSEIDKQAEKLAYNYLTIPRGGEFFIELSDGTKVWLNADSKLKYPIAFKEGEPRKIELLYGEAYFDVSPSTDHNGDSFIVNLLEQEIEVLGTEFNVKAYKEEKIATTTLVEGKVAVKTNNEMSLLVPNQQLVFTKETDAFLIKTVDVKNVVSWKSGYFSFSELSFNETINLLSRWYNVEFIIENKNLFKIKFNGVLSKNQNIENILQSFKNTNNIKYEIKENKIYLK